MCHNLVVSEHLDTGDATKSVIKFDPYGAQQILEPESELKGKLLGLSSNFGLVLVFGS